MSIIINPGTDPIEAASSSAASVNAVVFNAELSMLVGGEVVVERSASLDGVYAAEYGRYAFTLTHGNRSVLVHMPGLPLEQVRYTGEADQNIWLFPRLYVDHSSYVWCYALNKAAEHLSDDEDGQS